MSRSRYWVLTLSLVALFLGGAYTYITATVSDERLWFAYSYYCKSSLTATHCDVRLETSIADAEQYRELLQRISLLGAGDTANWYLVGNGGSGRGMEALLNTISMSKAKHTAIVIGDVYSAHAYLAIGMHELIVAESNPVMLFHRGSTYGQEDAICNGVGKGKDRTISMELKCRLFFNYMHAAEEVWLKAYFRGIMPEADIVRIIHGEDVLFMSDYIKKNFDKLHKVK